MKVCVAIDSFKGSLTSLEAGEAIKESIFKVYPESLIEVCPLADGGEGTTEALAKGLGGELIYINAKDPLLRDIKAYYGIIKKKISQLWRWLRLQA